MYSDDQKLEVGMA